MDPSKVTCAKHILRNALNFNTSIFPMSFILFTCLRLIFQESLISTTYSHFTGTSDMQQSKMEALGSSLKESIRHCCFSDGFFFICLIVFYLILLLLFHLPTNLCFTSAHQLWLHLTHSLSWSVLGLLMIYTTSSPLSLIVCLII